ncbi:potassium-transporting ATPase subunit beta [Ambystoma mexicanum]|uniref:potassium-transporting ATPase subunit beta n=1 Tax=Ambystoma mexicanum TaxID=8296 RepID=UPI0037E9903C
MATFNEKKTCSQRMENFGRFVWNPDTGELMGRTLIKWVYISLYYVAFYAVIIGLFALSIFSLMKTLNPYVPDYQDRLLSPGVTIRPFHYVEEDIDICFNISDPSSWETYKKSLQTYLEAYNSTTQSIRNVNCTSVENIKALLSSPGGRNRRACQFTTDMLGECSGREDPNFGFHIGQPCFVVKLNRIIGFVPGNVTAPYVNCTSKNSDDLGRVEYYPKGGNFSFDYFPYYGKKAQPNYTNPLVAVKFVNVKPNTKIPVVCKVVGTKISTDNPHDPYEGKVEFTLEIKS